MASSRLLWSMNEVRQRDCDVARVCRPSVVSTAPPERQSQ
jgi:hypothetical protein